MSNVFAMSGTDQFLPSLSFGPPITHTGSSLAIEGLGGGAGSEAGTMAFITFITPYTPIVCGIADYADFIVRESPPGACDVLSFNLENYGTPLHNDRASFTHPVCYGIPSRDSFSAGSILEWLRPHEHQVLWFQHEFGIWRNSARFIDMLKALDHTKVVTLHTLHFQSTETPYGLRRKEYLFLHLLLPHTDAITVFSDGVYQAVIGAFPEHMGKVHVLRHGAHVYPEIARMRREKAKTTVHGYLVGRSRLDQASKDKLRREPVFLDPDTIVMGGAGFICGYKGTERLYQAHSALEQMLPRRNIAAVYVGFVRDDSSISSEAASELRARGNGTRQLFLETYLPGDMLPILLRALDAYFYWPNDCTQSGMVAHALGAGATIVSRDMEGVGETVRMAGGLAYVDFEQAIAGLRETMSDTELRNEMSGRAVRYAEEFSWRNQALQHFELAEQLRCSGVDRLVRTLPLIPRIEAISQPLLPISGETSPVVSPEPV